LESIKKVRGFIEDSLFLIFCMVWREKEADKRQTKTNVLLIGPSVKLTLHFRALHLYNMSMNADPTSDANMEKTLKEGTPTADDDATKPVAESVNKENNAAVASKPHSGGYDVPWVERYRPKSLDDVVGNEETLVRLRAIAKHGNMPNIILCGPPGTGKV
jgi:ATP-dependent Clp protease ATP-binding subunit ClpA